MREPTKYAIALVVVLALQYLSFGLHFAGVRNTAVPLVVAGVMVLVSATVFMELRRSSAVARIVGVLAVLFIALLCLGIAGDVMFR